jgi:hypothetical protein
MGLKKLIYALVALSILSIILAVISRLLLMPIMGIESYAMIGFANTLLLLAIALGLILVSETKSQKT